MALRLNVRRLKSLLWIVVGLAALPAGWSFYDIVQGKHEGRYSGRPSGVFGDVLWSEIDETPKRIGPQEYALQDRATTWLARIDGSRHELPVVGEPPQQPEQPGLVALETVLEVGLIVWSDDPLRRLVGLAYREPEERPGRVRRLHVTEGELLRKPFGEAPYNGRVVAIGPQTVTIAWGEEQFVVHPGFGGSAQTAVQADAFSIDAAPRDGAWISQSKTVQLDDGTWLLGRDDRERLAGSTSASFLEGLAVTTVRPGRGARSQLELTEVREGSLPARFGFLSGDRVLSINGMPMPDLASVINWVRAHPDLARYDVVHERRGQRLSLTIRSGTDPGSTAG